MVSINVALIVFVNTVFHQIEARASIVSRRGFDGPLFRGGAYISGGLLIPTTNWPEPLITGLLILTKHLTGTGNELPAKATRLVTLANLKRYNSSNNVHSSSESSWSVISSSETSQESRIIRSSSNSSSSSSCSISSTNSAPLSFNNCNPISQPHPV